MSADKYPRIFSRQMEAIVYLYVGFYDVICALCIKYGERDKVLEE